jgi:OOP family OmpA-OmpF porin
MKRSLAVLALGSCLALPLLSVLARAEEAAETALQLPLGASALSRRETALGTYALPVGAFSASGIPLRLEEGHILRRTWQVRGSASVLQVVKPLRRQLEAEGFEILFQCESRQCGGFDFRFGIEVVPAPDMVISLSDYHFLAAAKPDSPDSSGGSDSSGGRAALANDPTSKAQVVSLLVSRSGQANYVQLIEVSPVEQAPIAPLAIIAPQIPTPEAAPGLAVQLRAQGHAVLNGLVFETGAATLGQASVPSLERLAAFLTAEPEAKVLIVGHTDSLGGFENNQALSQRRAAVAKEALVAGYGADPDRIDVAGAGYMAPIASNLSVAGRESNRRVEVVLIAE